ncbi:MAG: hypothetical protein AAGB04_09395 [Pseudomonadota bacterium]
MEELQNPNLMRVVGLFFATFGIVLLAKVVTSHTYLADNEADRAELDANRRYVGMWFCIPIIVVGFQIQVLAEFISQVPTAAIPLAFLGLGLWMLFYITIEGLIAERMLDTRKASEARRHRENIDDKNDWTVHMRASQKARVA